MPEEVYEGRDVRTGLIFLKIFISKADSGIISASVAQRQSDCFVSSRLWVQIPPEAFNIQEGILRPSAIFPLYAET